MNQVEVINLSTSDNKIKYKALRAAGFDTVAKDNKGLILIDKRVRNSDYYVESDFKDIDDILRAVASYILKAGYKITAA